MQAVCRLIDMRLKVGSTGLPELGDLDELIFHFEGKTRAFFRKKETSPSLDTFGLGRFFVQGTRKRDFYTFLI